MTDDREFSIDSEFMLIENNIHLAKHSLCNNAASRLFDFSLTQTSSYKFKCNKTSPVWSYAIQPNNGEDDTYDVNGRPTWVCAIGTGECATNPKELR